MKKPNKGGRGKRAPRKPKKSAEDKGGGKSVALAKVPQQMALMSPTYSKEQVQLIKNTVARGATNDELALFLHYCGNSGLDPLRKQAHFVKRKSKCQECYGKGCKECDRGYIKVATFIAGIDGLHARAEKFSDYEGIMSGTVRSGDEFEFNAAGGTVTHKFGTKRGEILGAWATVSRHKHMPLTVYIDAAEYPAGDSYLHKTKRGTMMEKTARSQALRRSFPEPFSAVYSPEEFGGQSLEAGEVWVPEEPAQLPAETGGGGAEEAPAKKGRSSSRDEGPVSDGQRKKFWAVCAEVGLKDNKEIARAFLRNTFPDKKWSASEPSSKDLTYGEMSTVLNRLQKVTDGLGEIDKEGRWFEITPPEPPSGQEGEEDGI